MFLVTLAALAIISLSPATAHAAGAPAPVSSAEYENVCYIETIITDSVPDSNTINALSSSQTITKTKTTYYKNARGETMWYVAVTATQTGVSGISHDYTQSVTIQCSPTGEVS